VKEMKTKISLLSSLLWSSTLFLAVTAVKADELIVKDAANLSSYCHMQFPEMQGDTLSWDRPVLDESSGNIVDFYGSCDHDPIGADEIKAQHRIENLGFYGDGE
jgi:hypothetical protein